MKRNYQTPYMEVENFLPNKFCSGCTDSETYKNNPVEVDCIITQSHYIFYDACTQGKYSSTGVNYNSANIVTCTDDTNQETGKYKEYLVWTSGTSKGTKITLSDCTLYKNSHDLIDHFSSKLGLRGGMVHAGVITPEIEKIRNQS